MNQGFEALINKELKSALLKQGIERPAEVQIKAIPEMTAQRDVIVCSETGSGKTLAYLLPVFMMADKEIKKPQALIVTPTHELAAQVHKQAELIIKNAPEYSFISPALIIGGANIQRQIEKIKQKPRIIIGSAGRILELIKMKKLTAHFVKTIVLDEADRLLDSQNIDSIMELIKTTLRDRQIALFSASINERDIETAKKILNQPVVIDMRKNNKMPESIEHIFFESERRDKIKLLRKIVHSEEVEKAIVFFSNPDSKSIDSTAEKLNYHGVKSAALYGDINKHGRRQALLDFREGRAKLLLASDLAARGLDFDDLTHVINFDMPEDFEIYLHRAGRCGRMGNKGVCISLITSGDIIYVKKMEKFFGIKIIKKAMSFGNISDTKDNSDSRKPKMPDKKINTGKR